MTDLEWLLLAAFLFFFLAVAQLFVTVVTDLVERLIRRFKD